MVKLVKAIIAAFYWSRSVSLSATEQYEKALLCLEKSSKFRKKFDEEFFLQHGFLLGATNNKKTSIDSLKKAIEYAMSEKSMLNSDEKIYLINYATMIASFLGVYGAPFEINESYDIDKVSRHLTGKFRYRSSLFVDKKII